VIKEAAIMFESGAFRQMDFIINVSAPENLRISRVCSRDGLEPDAVRLRIRNQMSDEDRSAKSDFVIFNDDSQLLMPQILKIHEVLLKKALPGIPEK
jgi:dephospho-CoA kinase